MSGTSNEYYPIILDLGQEFIRAGFAGDALPMATIKFNNRNVQVVANKLPPYFNLNDASLTPEQYDKVVSSLISSNSTIERLSEVYCNDILKIKLPQNISDNNLQSVLIDIFSNHLLISPSRTKLIITDANYSILHKSRILKILLCRIGVRSIIWVPESTSSVISANSTNGLVVCFHWDSLLIDTIIDLRTIYHLEELNKFNGCSLHYKIIEKMIELDDENINKLIERNDFFDIIENFVANAIYVRSIEDKANDLTMFQMSEGVFIPNKLRFQVVETMFFGENNISQLILNTINKSAIDLKATLLDNIIITGEISNIPGFKTRLIQETRKLISSKVSCKVTLGPWTGCSLYCSTTLVRQNEQLWKSMEITKENLINSISEEGISLTNIPDSFNSLYKNSI